MKKLVCWMNWNRNKNWGSPEMDPFTRKIEVQCFDEWNSLWRILKMNRISSVPIWFFAHFAYIYLFCYKITKMKLLYRSGHRCDMTESGRFLTVKLKIQGKSMGKAGYRTSVTFKLYFLTLAIYQWQWLGLSKSATMKKMWKMSLLFFTFFSWLRTCLVPTAATGR